jgi:hypothetical protein
MPIRHLAALLLALLLVPLAARADPQGQDGTCARSTKDAPLS